MRRLQLSHRHLPGQVTMIAVAGAVDLHSCGRLRGYLDEVRRCPGEQLVFDMTDVPYIDGSGVQVLVEAHRYARDHGTIIRMAGLRPQALRTLEVTQPAWDISVHLTLEAALRVVLADRRIASCVGHHSAGQTGLDTPD
ncbi:STAS domain-containing protein [Spirillospora sp. CA-128828]|uniref:STAS domain-containing protein n=1 Tax=Spirillospora sp. CA-128828 TaxID=3240033 RepID=UPI003D8BD87D